MAIARAYPRPEAGGEQGRGWLELSAGDPAAALAALRGSDAILAQLGARAVRSTTQALFAQVYRRLENIADVIAAIELSDELGDTEDVVNFIITDGVRAWLALADGDSEAAENWARSAVDHASMTDNLVQQANTKLNLALRPNRTGSAERSAILEAQAALDLFLNRERLLPVGCRPDARPAP